MHTEYNHVINYRGGKSKAGRKSPPFSHLLLRLHVAFISIQLNSTNVGWLPRCPQLPWLGFREAPQSHSLETYRGIGTSFPGDLQLPSFFYSEFSLTLAVRDLGKVQSTRRTETPLGFLSCPNMPMWLYVYLYRPPRTRNHLQGFSHAQSFLHSLPTSGATLLEFPSIATFMNYKLSVGTSLIFCTLQLPFVRFHVVLQSLLRRVIQHFVFM